MSNNLCGDMYNNSSTYFYLNLLVSLYNYSCVFILFILLSPMHCMDKKPITFIRDSNFDPVVVYGSLDSYLDLDNGVYLKGFHLAQVLRTSSSVIERKARELGIEMIVQGKVSWYHITHSTYTRLTETISVQSRRASPYRSSTVHSPPPVPVRNVEQVAEELPQSSYLEAPIRYPSLPPPKSRPQPNVCEPRTPPPINHKLARNEREEAIILPTFDQFCANLPDVSRETIHAACAHLNVRTDRRIDNTQGARIIHYLHEKGFIRNLS